ncbi:hypothetical protein D9M68_908350 [compost metagenome]
MFEFLVHGHDDGVEAAKQGCRREGIRQQIDAAAAQGFLATAIAHRLAHEFAEAGRFGCCGSAVLASTTGEVCHVVPYLVYCGGIGAR